MVPLSYAIRAASASSVSKLSDPAAEKVEQAVAKWDSNSFSAHPAEKLSRSMEYSPSIIFFFPLSSRSSGCASITTQFDQTSVPQSAFVARAVDACAGSGREMRRGIT